ncbi:phosphate ABC transporter substrate-binding protein PstS family protein [Clostridium sp. P21]|uniref:Phosphate-binding protein n=1 Tax=Clostridium muellerianum TaxID=2716538 RepID=A0A7Y0ELF6_9CLOT|nr:phosphate ABC transporter substrate-binding protein PstS family protein [Clostridium muellerianum]NMM65615.1 phosphate ABC transporter substrate-binding protein PstS family protein [Clostridium muellerianum]
MKRKGFRIMIAALAVIFVTGAFVGCGSKQQSSSEDSKKQITLGGSTALQPLAEQVGKKFTEKNSGATINVQGGGSGTGMKLVSEGTVDIGNSDITAEAAKLDAQKVKELVDHKVCAIGFAVVVNKDVKVDSLTKDQIQKIFTGEITNWNQVGGDNLPINVINRAKSSGTRGTFKDTVMGGKDEKEGLGTTQDSNGNVEKGIESTKGSISYLALSYLSDKVKENVKPLKIDGVDANEANIVAGKYSFWSYEHMYTKGEAKDLSKAFIDYMVNSENNELIKKLGYIPMGEIKNK